MNRPVIPAALLVVTLPVATWHLFGDQTDYSDDSLRLFFIWRAPGWLNELAHPIGLVVSLVVVAALTWLAVEYWLEHWRKWWFMMLGSLCMLGPQANGLLVTLMSGNISIYIDIQVKTCHANRRNARAR